MRVVTKSIAAENVYSDGALFRSGNFTFALAGKWVATVWLQQFFDGAWWDIEALSQNCVKIGTAIEDNSLYRFGVKQGEYQRGTINGLLRQ